MVQAMKRFWNNQRGVTLIELLAVVVILGIIAAIAAPSVLTGFDDAKNNSDKQTEEILKDAGKRYVAEQLKTTPKDSIDLTENVFNHANSKLDDYVDGYDANGEFVSQVDATKKFEVTITNGVVVISQTTLSDDAPATP